MQKYFSYRDEALEIVYSRDEKPEPANFSMHTHETYELYYFEGGSGIYRVEGTPYPLEPGDILIMRPAEAHCIDITGERVYTRFSVNFTPDILAGADPELKLLTPFNNREPGFFNRYRAESFADGAYFELIKNLTADCTDRRLQTVTNLLPLLNEIYKAFVRGETEVLVKSLDSRIIRHINRHISESLTLDEICESFYISKSYLCRSFKNATGSTVGEYITVKRLVNARRLILSGTPPTKAYLQCGFKDYSAFYRAYKKKYGVAPSALTSI